MGKVYYIIHRKISHYNTENYGSLIIFLEMFCGNKVHRKKGECEL